METFGVIRYNLMLRIKWKIKMISRGKNSKITAENILFLFEADLRKSCFLSNYFWVLAELVKISCENNKIVSKLLFSVKIQKTWLSNQMQSFLRLCFIALMRKISEWFTPVPSLKFQWNKNDKKITENYL